MLHILHDGQPHSWLSFALGILAGLILFGGIALKNRSVR
jgi:hypothetical protein